MQDFLASLPHSMPAFMWVAYGVFLLWVAFNSGTSPRGYSATTTDFSRMLWVVMMIPILLLPFIAWWGLGFNQAGANGLLNFSTPETHIFSHALAAIKEIS